MEVIYRHWGLTLFRPLEADVELLHVVVYQRDLVVAHQHLHDVRLDSALRAGHLGCAPLLLSVGSISCYERCKDGVALALCHPGAVKSWVSLMG